MKNIKSNLALAIQSVKKLLFALRMEGVETIHMVAVLLRSLVFKCTFGKAGCTPTSQEYKNSLNQIKDIPRLLPFFLIVLIPVPGLMEVYIFSAIGIEKLFGGRFSILPSQFRKIFKKN